jgi:AAA family ATP:ADP antiporter
MGTLETASAAAPLPAASTGALDRALRVFGDVRSNEGGAVLLQLGNLFLLLVGYYILKTVREPWILASGAEMKSYASAFQAATLMGLVPLYGWVAARVNRLQLITWVLLFFIADIELFNLGVRLGVPYLGFVFYVWVGIFSLATIAQFWSFANDLYSKPDGERLFPLIAIGATAGSPIGAKLASVLFESGVKPEDMLHISAVLVAIHLALYRAVSGRFARRGETSAAAERLSGPGGFALVARSGYLQLIAVLLVLLNVVNTTGEYVIGKSVVAAAEAAKAANPSLDTDAFIGAFYGDYYFWVNVATVTIQALLVARLVRVAGIAGVLLALPLVSLSVYALIAAGVGFGVLRWAKTLENATDYSVMNTGRHMLWLPTTRDEKYKAKQALDTFFVRGGDMVSAGLVFAGTSWLGLSVKGFAAVNVALALVWLYLGVRLVARNKQMVAHASARG